MAKSTRNRIKRHTGIKILVATTATIALVPAVFAALNVYTNNLAPQEFTEEYVGLLKQGISKASEFSKESYEEIKEKAGGVFLSDGDKKDAEQKQVELEIKKAIESKVIVDPETIVPQNEDEEEAKEYFEAISNTEEVYKASPQSHYLDVVEKVTITKTILDYYSYFIYNNRVYLEMQQATTVGDDYISVKGVYRVTIFVNDNIVRPKNHDELMQALKNANNILIDFCVKYDETGYDNYKSLAQLYSEKYLFKYDADCKNLLSKGYTLSFVDGVAYGATTNEVLNVSTKIKAQNKKTGDTKYFFLQQNFLGMTVEEFNTAVTSSPEDLSFGDRFAYLTDDTYNRFKEVQQVGRELVGDENAMSTEQNDRVYVLEGDRELDKYL